MASQEIFGEDEQLPYIFDLIAQQLAFNVHEAVTNHIVEIFESERSFALELLEYHFRLLSELVRNFHRCYMIPVLD